MGYACTVFIALSETQRQKLEKTENRYLRYARRAVDSTCVSNNALADSLSRKASKSNDDSINLSYHH